MILYTTIIWKKEERIVNVKLNEKEQDASSNDCDWSDEETDTCEQKEAGININIVSRSIWKDRLAFPHLNKFN